MITEETKIKDLIPEGLEFDGNINFYKSEEMNRFHVHFDVKPVDIDTKSVKDWNWYIENYLKNIMFLQVNTIEIYLGFIENNDYDLIPFEIKIGLLKFICDDIQEDYILFLHQFNKAGPYLLVERLKSICPAEFLKSIFE